MDLRFFVRTAIPAVAGITKCLAAATLFFAVVSQASASRAGSDYLHPSDSRGGFLYSESAHAESAGAMGKTEAQMRYMAFDGRSYTLQEHRGRYVSVLTPQSVANGPSFTAEHVDELVHRLDELYSLYREILGLEPSGSGLLTVAFVDQTCGAGCGLLGAKGIEIEASALNYEMIIDELNAGRLESILVHEMVHNFDAYANHLHYLPDHAHAWTDFFQYFAAYRYGRNSYRDEAPDDVFKSPVSAAWKDYMADDTASWARCVRDGACASQGLTENNVWAMPFYRMEELYGTEAMVRALEFLSDYVRTKPAPADAEGRESLRVLALAHGAEANIACHVRSLKWTLPSQLESEMNRLFGGAGPLCEDSDRDGFVAVTGDCAEGDPLRHVYRAESMGNGLDDDCDGFVDETVLDEAGHGSGSDPFGTRVQSSLTFEAAGNASNLNDHDAFSFALAGASRVRVSLCSAGSFNGWAVALDTAGDFLEEGNWYSYQSGPGCSSTTFDFSGQARGNIVVMPDSAAGDYTLTVNAASELPDEYSALLAAMPRASGGVRLVVDDADEQLRELGADELEFWISGTNVRLSVPYSPTSAVTLTGANAAELSDGNLYQARLRPKANGQPLAAFSAGHLFRYRSGATSLPRVDGAFSGAWYDPSHSGEGFVLEVLENQQAVVYWFTYDANGSQRWMIGIGEVDGERVVFDEMLDSRGGRFGAGFNPDDVVLEPVGSLSITFQNCTEAVANYSIDKVGGSQQLTRLSHVYGHRCGAEDAPAELDLSGSWYDPTHSGEGFVLEQISATEALVFWFSYDAEGEQAWFFNTGTVDDGRVTFPDLLQPVGGKFGRSYDPETIQLQPWGELELQLDCTGGPASYAAEASGFGSGVQNLTRLTHLEGSGCNR
jgi:hypothetical protein